MISLQDLHYHLPEEQIAQYPLPERDGSRLLSFQQGQIGHHLFKQLPDLLPANSLLVFNTSKVIPARLVFQKSTGAKIEILLLQPREEGIGMQIDLTPNHALWHAMIGNAKKWKNDEVLRLEKDDQWLEVQPVHLAEGLVRLDWSPTCAHLEAALAIFGAPPLPPYLHRQAEKADWERYQTVFSKQAGSVAAPTAGLHFTQRVVDELANKGIQFAELTLHVGAGTFQPVKTENVLDHPMHQEWFEIEKSTLEKLSNHHGPIIPVGTTAMRTLETLYTAAGDESLLQSSQFPDIRQRPTPHHLTRKAAFEKLGTWMNHHQHESICAATGIYLTPGYTFGFCDGIITNFHQPGSTLLLLVSAFIGEGWKAVYAEALREGYRFLSYGDSSLLWKS